PTPTRWRGRFRRRCLTDRDPPASSPTSPVTQMTAFIGTRSHARSADGSRADRSVAWQSRQEGRYSRRSCRQFRGLVLVRALRENGFSFRKKCLLERKRSFLTENELFSREVVRGAATEPINFIKEESDGTRSTPHRHWA